MLQTPITLHSSAVLQREAECTTHVRCVICGHLNASKDPEDTVMEKQQGEQPDE